MAECVLRIPLLVLIDGNGVGYSGSGFQNLLLLEEIGGVGAYFSRIGHIFFSCLVLEGQVNSFSMISRGRDFRHNLILWVKNSY